MIWGGSAALTCMTTVPSLSVFDLDRESSAISRPRVGLLDLRKLASQKLFRLHPASRSRASIRKSHVVPHVPGTGLSPHFGGRENELFDAGDSTTLSHAVLAFLHLLTINGKKFDMFLQSDCVPSRFEKSSTFFSSRRNCAYPLFSDLLEVSRRRPLAPKSARFRNSTPRIRRPVSRGPRS